MPTPGMPGTQDLCPPLHKPVPRVNDVTICTGLKPATWGFLLPHAQNAFNVQLITKHHGFFHLYISQLSTSLRIPHQCLGHLIISFRIMWQTQNCFFITHVSQSLLYTKLWVIFYYNHIDPNQHTSVALSIAFMLIHNIYNLALGISIDYQLVQDIWPSV